MVIKLMEYNKIDRDFTPVFKVKNPYKLNIAEVIQKGKANVLRIRPNIYSEYFSK